MTKQNRFQGSGTDKCYSNTGEGGPSLDDPDRESFQCKCETRDTLVSNKVNKEAFWEEMS